MHFSKTYAQLLEDLPPELQESAVQYRQLKKIINQIVNELSSLGLNPPLLHKLLENKDDQPIPTSLQGSKDLCASVPPSTSGRVPSPNATSIISGHGLPKAVYEFSEDPKKIEAQLRIYVDFVEDLGGIFPYGTKERDVEEQNKGDGLQDDDLKVTDSNGLESHAPPGNSLLWTLQKAAFECTTGRGRDGGCFGAGFPTRSWTPPDEDSPVEAHELVIPLVSDSEFFVLLHTTIEHMSTQLKSVESNFMETLKTLSRTIGDSARPVSSSHSVLGRSFHALSPLKDDAAAIHVRRGDLPKSDLYSWREIFQLYIEAEIFESMHERDRGERSIEECEWRLQLFANQVTQRGLAAQSKFKLKGSRCALEAFLQLIILILNIRKFQSANSEAIRKILKKHTKRTALPHSPDASSQPLSQLVLGPQFRSSPLPRILVQAIGETLLPIIPHLDDYSCLICTTIAFKPIRLDCGHLFCVRCLVKMQKRGKGDCPLCRAPSVLSANRSNVDWALMNFMQDWFPLEAKEKLKANEEEVTAEELAELGLDINATCIIM